MGLRTLTPMREPLGCNYFPACELPIQEEGILPVLQKCPSYHLIVFGYRISFLVGSILFCQWLFSCCDFGVFMKGVELKYFYSAILSPASASVILNFISFDLWNIFLYLWRRKWQPILIFFPGKSHGQRSLVGYSP